jgi:hypothetical protein
MLNKPIIGNATGGGNVISYNYVPNAVIVWPGRDAMGDGTMQPMQHDGGANESAIDLSHGGYSHSDLAEGNWTANIHTDGTTSNGWFTVFRNHSFGQNIREPLTTRSGTRAGLAIDGAQNWHVSVGNVYLNPTNAEGASTWRRPDETTGSVFAYQFSNGGGNNSSGSGMNGPAAMQWTYDRFYHHYDYNYVDSAVLMDPSNSFELPDSLYLSSAPDFFTQVGMTWPPVDPDGGTHEERVGDLPSVARYENRLYTLTFSGNGTNMFTTRAVLLPATTLGSAMPANPARDGYSFTGWNTEPDGSGTAFTSTTELSFENPPALDAMNSHGMHKTLYAQWEYTPPPPPPPPPGGGDETDIPDGGDTPDGGETPDGTEPPVEPIPDDVISDVLESGDTLVLEEGDSTVISEEALQLIRDSDTVLEIELPSGRRVRINPETITDDAVSIDLNVDVIITSQATDIPVVTDTGTREVRIPANSIVINPATHGNFGFTLEIDISAEELRELGLRGDNVRLFYVGDDGSVQEMGRIRRNADGSITILIDSASRYVLAERAPRIAAIISRLPVFPDVTRGVAYNAVQWAAAEEIITGRRGLFLPDDNMTREQFVLILYRYAGEPGVNARQVFDDVAVTRPGARAVTWAHTTGIARGERGMFRPDDTVTREQAVLMLYRYTALIRGNTTFAANSINPFIDRNRIASVAMDAMNWAVSQDLVTGNRDLLTPKDNITRAQAVLILHRFHTALLG